jgi:hypothetical protein
MKNLLLFIGFISFILSGCQKETYGNTDITSDTYVVSWVFDDPSYKTTISEPKITQEIIDNGAVMVYKSNENGGWIALPYTLPIDNTYSSTFSFVLYDGGVTIWKTDTDLLTLDPGTSTFKIVILSQHGLIKHPNLDLTDYKEVEKALDL